LPGLFNFPGRRPRFSAQGPKKLPKKGKLTTKAMPRKKKNLP
jgi:hypothetical protein